MLPSFSWMTDISLTYLKIEAFSWGFYMEINVGRTYSSYREVLVSGTLEKNKYTDEWDVKVSADVLIDLLNTVDENWERNPTVYA